MIFTSNIARGLAEDVFTKLGVILVYSGSQPTASQFLSNFSLYNWAGSEVLQGYLNVDLTGVDITTTNYRIIKDSTSGTEYGAFSKRSGIASWAVLFHEDSLSGSSSFITFNSGTGSVDFSRNVSTNDKFMIVPVTNMAGYGVLKFNNLSFVHPHVSGSDTIENFTLNIKKRS